MRLFYARAGLSAALLGAPVLCGQSNTASVTGIVTDSADAVIPSALVAITNTDTGISRQMATSEAGDYTITNLQPGTYEMIVKVNGFRPYRQTQIVLAVGQVYRNDVRLELGAVTESVIVAANAITINTESGTIKGDVINEQEIQELPLDGRDFTDLALFVPGVVPRARGGQGSALNVNGARASNTNFYVDGFNNRNARGAAAQIRPNIDALQEFKMEVSGFSAEYGKMAGGILNMVIKSGTNRTHGSVFHYLRNDVLDARGFFERDKNKLRRNQFGATVNGPVFRNRTFYLASFEGYTQVIGQTRLGHVPSGLERTGNFSQSVDFLGRRIALRDPLMTGTCSATNRAACFPGNLIPPSRLSVPGMNILRFYPLPNRPDIRNNYLVTANDADKWSSVLTKVDHRFSEKDSVSFRHQIRFNRTQNPFAGGSDLGVYGSNITDNRSLAGVDWTHMFSSTTLFEIRGGFSRNAQRERGNFQGEDMAGKLGLPVLTADPELSDWPRITVRDHFQLGTGDNQPVQFHVTDFQLNAKLTWVRSRHTLKAGWDVSRVRFNQPYFNNIRGTYNFQGRWTNAPIADLMLGLLNNSSRQVGIVRNYWRLTSYGAFLNDDWKATRTLTLNLGLRYEVNKPPVDRYDQLANFVPGLNKVILAGAPIGKDLRVLTRDAGLEERIALRESIGFPRSLVYTDYTNFAPRVGFAWRPFGTTSGVLRGGYGIFYGGDLLNPLRNQLANNFPYSIRQTFNRVTSDPAAVTLETPFPANRATLTGVTNAFGYDTHAPTSYLQSWNLTVERELTRSSAIEIGYAGSKGTHLGRRYDYNQPFRSLENYLAGLGFPKPIPELNAANYFAFGTNSIYNTLQASLRKRGRGDFFYRLNYAYSKSIDDASQLNDASAGGFPDAQDSRNLKLERGRSDFDIGHAFSALFSYELPFGRGGHRGNRLGSWGQALLAGWQLSGTARAYTGQPFTVRTSDVELNLGESQRPNRLRKGTQADNAASGRRGPDFPWFDLLAFEEAPCADVAGSSSCLEKSAYGFLPFSFGNSGRNILDGPGLFVADLGMRKNMRFGESRNLQLRLDAFNLINRTNFYLPDNFFNAITGGLITRVGESGREGGPRVFQGALTFRF